MQIEKKLGKIRAVSFGAGGYQDAMIGISFTLGGESWGVCDFWGEWSMERDEYCKWTDQDRINTLGTVVMRINALLKEAKKSNINGLQGIPVEATFSGNALQSWRVLTEVI